MKNALLRLCLCAGLSVPFVAQEAMAQGQVQTARVNGVELHYVEQGRGVAVIFVHGGLEDYRAWEEQVAAFSRSYHAVAYSRRYNFPNKGAPRIADYSAATDADDLAALIVKLRLAPAHVVGYSYGAYAALLLAARHPELVRSLVLSEAPVLRLLPEVAGGQALFDDFMSKVWQPAARGFRQGNEAGVKAAVDGFGNLGYSGTDEKMTFAGLPAQVRSALLEDGPEWKALTASKNAFPAVPLGAVARIQTSTLLLSGERSLKLADAIDGLLVRTLPHASRVVLPNATHDMWSEYPKECREATLAFLDQR